MPEDPAAPDAPSATPAASAPTGATPTASATGATPAKPTTEEAHAELERARARIAELEKHAANKEEEAKRHGKKLKAYEDAEEQQRLAAMSDFQKAEARATNAEKLHQEAQTTIKQYQQQLAVAHVKLAAQAKGIIDPELAALAIQSSLEYGEDGMPTNIEKALDTLVKNKPYLKKADSAVPETPAPASPVQSAPAAQRTPAIPAMNPGRSSIAAPNSTPPGQIPRLSDVYRQSRRQ